MAISVVPGFAKHTSMPAAWLAVTRASAPFIHYSADFEGSSEASSFPYHDAPRISMIGTELEGRYRIEAELGAGGVGTVYRAVHLKLGRPVAIKLLKPEYGSSADLRDRFEREARALAALAHPNIVNVTDSGVAGDTPYLVMELLEGETLSERLKRGALEPDEAFAIARDLVKALVFVHENGLVHRDVKPGNVFLQKAATGRPVVRLLDFGLAKFVAPEVAGRVITRAGQVFGTPTYMAPEQVAGQEADARADVYALGIILFEMIAGKAPFRGNWSELMRQHLMEDLPSIQSVCPDRAATPALASLLARATAKTRAERFQTVRELGNALEALPKPAVLVGEGVASLAHDPTHLDPSNSHTRVEKGLAPVSRPVPSDAPTKEQPAPLVEALGAAPDFPDASANDAEPGRLSDAFADVSRSSARARDDERPPGFFRRFQRRIVRLVLGVFVTISLTALIAAAAVVYVLMTPGRVQERKALDELFGFVAGAGQEPRAVTSAALPGDKPAPRPAPTDRVKTLPTAPARFSEPAAPATEIQVATNASEPEPPPSAAAAPPAPSAEPTGAPTVETASAPPNPENPTPTPTPPVTPPPNGPAPDPWTTVPRDLGKFLSKVNHGRALDKKEILAIHHYNAKHVDDPRGHLVLARAYLERRWLKDAVSEYAIAYKVSSDARGDPRMLRDLVGVVEFGSSEAERLLTEAYGAAAVPAIDRALGAPPTPEAKEHLERFRKTLAP